MVVGESVEGMAVQFRLLLFTSHHPCLSEETLKAINPVYMVSGLGGIKTSKWCVGGTLDEAV